MGNFMGFLDFYDRDNHNNDDEIKNNNFREIAESVHICLETNLKDLEQENVMLRKSLEFYKNLYYEKSRMIDDYERMNEELTVFDEGYIVN
jgi:hypothetical protein